MSTIPSAVLAIFVVNDGQDLYSFISGNHDDFAELPEDVRQAMRELTDPAQPHGVFINDEAGDTLQVAVRADGRIEAFVTSTRMPQLDANVAVHHFAKIMKDVAYSHGWTPGKLMENPVLHNVLYEDEDALGIARLVRF